MLKCEVDSESVERFNAAFEHMRQRVRRFTEQAWPTAFGVYAQHVSGIFDREGPGWAPLAPATLKERQALGYGSGPILQREGYLADSLTIESGPRMVPVRTTEGTEMHRSGNVTHKETRGEDVHYRFGTLDDRFLELQEGNPLTNLPSRDMTPSSTLSREIEAELVKLIRSPK